MIEDKEQIEQAARLVYDAMKVAAKDLGHIVPEWVHNGNSDMQFVARSTARQILKSANPDLQQETVG